MLKEDDIWKFFDRLFSWGSPVANIFDSLVLQDLYFIRERKSQAPQCYDLENIPIAQFLEQWECIGIRCYM